METIDSIHLALGENNVAPNLFKRMLQLPYNSFFTSEKSLNWDSSHLCRKNLKQDLLKELYAKGGMRWDFVEHGSKELLYGPRSSPTPWISWGPPGEAQGQQDTSEAAL